MRASMPVNVGTASAVTSVHAAYPVHTIRSYCTGDGDANRYLGNGILFYLPAAATNTDILSMFAGKLYWIAKGSTHPLLPNFTAADDTILLRVLPTGLDDITGRGMCWPRPGFVTYENVDQSYVQANFPELLAGGIKFVEAGTTISRAPLIDGDSFVPTPGPAGPGLFHGFILKTWTSTGRQLVYPHIYVHHLRFWNTTIPVTNNVFATLRFGLADSVGPAIGANPSANDPHDVYVVHRRLLDLGFTRKPFPSRPGWLVPPCAHKVSDHTDDHKVGHWARNLHPPAFENLSSYHDGVVVSGAQSSLVLAASASTVQDHYVGMYVRTTGGIAAGQFRKITAYVGAARTITIADPWSTIPTAGSHYEIVDFSANGAVIAVIKLLQSIILGFRSDPLGHIDADGLILVEKTAGAVSRRSFTERWLWADEAPQWLPLNSGPGYHQSDGRTGDANHHDLRFHYGTNYLKDALRRVGRFFHDRYWRFHQDRSLIDTNDSSHEGGGITCEHKEHATGLDVDIRLPRTAPDPADPDEFMSGGIEHTYPPYDRLTSFWICKAFKSVAEVLSIFFNDPKIYSGTPANSYEQGVGRGGGGGNDSWIQLRAAASSVADHYNGMKIVLTAGPGSPATREIVRYDGVTQTVTVDLPWSNEVPDHTSSYRISARVDIVTFLDDHDNHMHVKVRPPSYQVAAVTRVNPRTWGPVDASDRSVFDHMN